MIQQLIIKNFKIHDNTNLELAPITLFTGLNGSGKSSVIQSLLLLRQSKTKGYLRYGLNLVGDICTVGTAEEIECHSSTSGICHISISDNNRNITYEFSYPSKTYYATTVLPLRSKTGSVKRLSLFGKNFQYIGANRIGPQTIYSRNSFVVEQENQISEKNGQCEYAVHFLHKNSKKRVLPQLAHGTETGADLSLEKQVQLWLREVSPNVSFDIEENSFDFRLKYNYSYPNQLKTSSIAAINTGYGISYVLPILIAVLSAKKDSLIIIENPEAHLHPNGIIALMRLFAKASNAGIQLLIETHCDRVVYCALEAINNQIIPSNNVALYFFENEKKKQVSRATKIDIQSNGYIQPNAPSAFYDIIDINYLTAQLPNP